MSGIIYPLVVSGVKTLPDCSFLFVESDRIITVVYHRVAIRFSDSATGVEIIKKRDFGVGFIVVRFFR